MATENTETNPTTTTTTTISNQSSAKKGRDFKYNEDGRRYHGYDEVAYVLPNDDDEADRVHQQHWILGYALQCNYHAPVSKMLKEGITVLDSGCGPATWTFEMGGTYPKSKFYGIDISCIFPEYIRPINVDFVIGNIVKHIPFPDNTFDYIHQRLLLAALTNDDWESTLKEQYRVLKPGGYIELAEYDVYDYLNIGPHWTKFKNATAGVFGSRDMPISIAGELKDRLAKAGFENQVLKIIPLPLNHTEKAGQLLWENFKQVSRSLRPFMAKINPEWEDIQVFEIYLNECSEEHKKNKTLVNWYACYAQKPLE